VRRELGLLIGLVIGVDALFFGIYRLADLGRSGPPVKLGFTVSWTLATLANRPADLAWIAAALLLAAIAGR